MARDVNNPMRRCVGESLLPPIVYVVGAGTSVVTIATLLGIIGVEMGTISVP